MAFTRGEPAASATSGKVSETRFGKPRNRMRERVMMERDKGEREKIERESGEKERVRE